jgi:hypothetical protein
MPARGDDGRAICERRTLISIRSARAGSTPGGTALALYRCTQQEVIMRGHVRLATALSTALTVGALYGSPAIAQQRDDQHHQQHARPRANEGHIPPAPQRHSGGDRGREPERLPNGRINDQPHVDHDRWFGHDSVNDARFRVVRPFEHGRFDRIGPSYRYDVERFDARAHRFWIAGRGGFEIAAWDWPLTSDWCWNCGDDFVVYNDPDHAGWYLVYNIHTGAYVHAQFLGR